ncbi:MAG: magnesium chelatase [Ignavibacteriales bacterium]|nr:magnesium chelatase [Ignavibacteriales bacterium]
MDIKSISTLGDLYAANYKSKSIKQELRENLIRSLNEGTNPLDGIIGYDETVIPDLQTAILSRHNIILLGLRGQAKTKIARLLINLLDEYIPIVSGSELNDDPLKPISKFAKDLIAANGMDTPITWLHRTERYSEKLATPDVSVADLIGDTDPIKAATLKLPYSDERVIHFGLIPRSHRCIFVMNELPDLQARIQVALFNILQENDIQIRGFKIRLPLDVQFVFTANPEDYTNRGSIVTPLKDRIESQILTHYPKLIADSMKITEQEAKLTPDQIQKVIVPDLIKELIEQISFEARGSEYIDPKSGVSARLTISAFENLISTVERRVILNNALQSVARVTDIYGVIPAITGKVELVYEGEQEGASKVANILIGKSIKSVFENYFPSPEKLKKQTDKNIYQPIISWFSKGNTIDLLMLCTDEEYRNTLRKIPGLDSIVETIIKPEDEKIKLLMMEFILYGLSEFSQLSKFKLENGVNFKDMLSSIFTMNKEEDEFGNEQFE